MYAKERTLIATADARSALLFGRYIGVIMSAIMPFERLAKQLLNDHGAEGTFEVTLFDTTQCDAIAEELRSMGCKVVKDRPNLCLTVTTPSAEKALA